MKQMILFPAFKYGFLAGSLIALFSFLKYTWLFSHAHPDLYLTLVAVFFTASGFWVYKAVNPYVMEPEFQAKKEAETDKPDFEELLSRREAEVLQLLLSNLSNKEIADKLCVSLSTLKTHINHIYHKAGVKTRKQLTQLLRSTIR